MSFSVMQFAGTSLIVAASLLQARAGHALSSCLLGLIGGFCAGVWFVMKLVERARLPRARRSA
jgi:hypothetical protein